MRGKSDLGRKEATVWLVGTLVLIGIGVMAIVAVGWAPRAVPSPPLWDIPSLSQTYTGIVGTIGGFSVASAIFIAGFDVARTSAVFATVMGMLLIAFLILVFSALTYASIPNAPDAPVAVTPALSHALANVNGCMGLSISWLALVPLLEMIGLTVLAERFTWLMLYVVLAASGWTAIFAYRLTPASGLACFALPALGFALPALYRLVASRLWTGLWPETDAALRYAFVAFGVAALTLSLHTSLLLWHGDQAVTRWLGANCHRLVLATSAATVLAVALTWFAVATV